MKVNPRFFVLCLMVLCSINLMTAQTRKDRDKFSNSENRSEKQLEKMTEELALTETQVNQLTVINADYATKMKTAKAASTDKETNRATFKTLRAEKTTAVKGILNSEQLAKHEAMKREHKGKRGDKDRKGKKGKRGADGRNAGTPEEREQKQTTRLTEQLSLSEAQAAKVAVINLAYAQKMKVAKDASTEKGTNREVWKTLRTAQDTAIKAVLTPEQLTTYEAMKNTRKGKGKKGRKH